MSVDLYLPMLQNGLLRKPLFSYAHSKRMEPKSALGAVYSTRLASFYPEGNMPEGISAAGDGLPFFTPSNQIRWSNPEKHCMTILVFS